MPVDNDARRNGWQREWPPGRTSFIGTTCAGQLERIRPKQTLGLDEIPHLRLMRQLLRGVVSVVAETAARWFSEANQTATKVAPVSCRLHSGDGHFVLIELTDHPDRSIEKPA